MENMFCFQCQETALNAGCKIKGVCGKDPQVACLMDTMLYGVRGMAIVNKKLREKDIACHKASRLMLDAIFSTITNANFDYESIKEKTNVIFSHKIKLIEKAKENSVCLPDMDEVYFNPTEEEYLNFKEKVGVLSEENEDIRSLKQLIIYGIKGMAAYTQHALMLGFEDDEIYKQIEDALFCVSRKEASVDELIAMTLSVGNTGFKAMAMLDKANTSTYGNPEITKVNIGVKNNPAILVSGHDLKDLEELLIQTQGTGVDVYTHGEMLPAHYYPFFKKYSNFVGNYGNAWWKQKEEFTSFNGPILFTTNCIVPPMKDASYKDKIFTTGSTGLQGSHYIDEREEGKMKDFSKIIAMAKQCQPPKEIEHGEIIGGFAHNQVEQLAGKVVEEIQKGNIKHFVVMAGCDGRMKSREYYTRFAELLPKDCVILTAGCAKYRYNKLNLGDINGIPRVLDAGQCNDSYSLVKTALLLKDAFKLDDVNKLPIIYNIAWYEQKAVIVLLALLSLGVKNIHLGPTLPAFVSQNVLNLLVEKFNIGTISTAEQDVKSFLQ